MLHSQMKFCCRAHQPRLLPVVLELIVPLNHLYDLIRIKQ